VCDSYVRPHVLVHICDECNYGSFEVISVKHVVEGALEILVFSANVYYLLALEKWRRSTDF
jgi:hypothetical protein